MIVGITGTDGAGKGTVVEYLVKNKGFTYYVARQLWVDEIIRRGLEVKRENMRIVANDLRRQHGNDYLVVAYIEKMKKDGVEKAIIESIRTIAEATTLKKHEGTLLAVDADQYVRYERIVRRASESDRVTFEQFAAQEELEMNDPDPNGMQKEAVMQMAEYTILNNGTLDELHAEIEKVLFKLHV